MAILESLAFGAGITGVNQLLSQYNAKQDYERQKALMDKQFGMQNALQKNSVINQVESLRMAGLNPALAGASPGSAQSVSLGSSSKADTFPLSPADMLIDAQRENIEADTAKKQSELPNIQADTSMKYAQRLKLLEEAAHIRNMNDSYASENRQLGEMGKVIAQRWQSSPWYQSLAPDTRNTVDAIASGELPLDVGGMSAVLKAIDMQKNLSEADRTLVRNAFDNEITAAQFNDKAVFDAVATLPDKQSKLIMAERDKLVAELPEIKERVNNLLADLVTKNLTQEQLRAEIDAFKRNDLGYLKSKGEYGKWLEGYAEEMLLRMLPFVTGGALAGKTAGKPSAPSKPEPSTIVKPGDPVFRSTLENMNKGVNQFRW